MYNNDLSDIPQLKANSKSAQLTYSSGKYGFTINNTFYEIGGGGMPTLNYTTPLHTFDSTHLTYTATKDCYLVGTPMTIGVSDTAILSINNKIIAIANNVAGNLYSVFVNVKLSAGDVVSVTNAGTTSSLYVFDVK